MSRRALIAMSLGVGMLVLAMAVANENEPTSNPQIIAADPPEVSAGGCFTGVVEDADPPITVSATWDDDSSSVSGTSGTGGFGGTSVRFSFCTSSSDVGRTFTIQAVDGNGNASTLGVLVTP